MQWWSAETGKRLGQTPSLGVGITAIAIRPIGPDGTPLILAAARKDKSISVIRFKSVTGPLENVATLQGHAEEIDALQISPDGKLLASGAKDGLLKVWEIDGDLRYNLKSHAMPVRSLAFSPDGNSLADASEDGDTNRWDVRTGKQIGSRLQLNAPGDGVAAVAFGPGGKTLATGGRRSLENKQAYAVIWDAGAEKLTQALVGHSANVTALAFSPDGKRLASGSMDHTVRIWNAQTGRQLAASEAHAGVLSVAVSRAAPLLASGSADSAVRIWSTKTGELLRILRGHLGAVNAVAFTPDGRQVISGGADGSVRWWDPATGEALRTVQSKSGPIRALVVSPDGSLVASGHRSTTQTGVIELRDRATGDLMKSLDERGLCPVESLAFSPDGDLLASGGGRGDFFNQISEIRLWNVKSGELISSKQTDNSGSVTALAFSPNGRSLASANAKLKHLADPRETFTGEIRIWNGQTLTFQRDIALNGSEAWANALTFLDDTTLASGGEDGQLSLWNARTGEAGGAFASPHFGPVAAFSLTADGKLLASAGADNTVRLWNAATHELVLTQATLSAASSMTDGTDATPSSDWLAATPEGFYDGTANASRQIQWRVGPDLFPIEAFEALRHNPGALKQSLLLMPPLLRPKNDPQVPHLTPPKITRGPKQQINPPPHTEVPHPDMSPAPSPGPGETAVIPDSAVLPPQITFEQPKAGASIDGNTLKVSGWVTDTGKTTTLLFQINGRVLNAKPLALGMKPLALGMKPLALGMKPLALGARSIPDAHKYYFPFEVELQLSPADQEIVVTAIAEDKAHLTGREELHLTRSRPAEKSRLFVLSVGVSQYKNPHFNLKYARSDAEAFGAMWQQHAGALYKEVLVTQLTDERATTENIRAAMSKLVKQATSSDCVAIFLSGHGLQDGNDYYFASHEIEPTPARIAATALPWTALQEALTGIPARRVILFLDACHAGNALGGMTQANGERIAEALVKKAGVMVFASSRGSELSIELDSVMHGAFTQALLEGIGEDKANLEIAGEKANSISAEDLLAYLRRRVPQLTDNRQTPSCPLIRDFGDTFPLAQVRK